MISLDDFIKWFRSFPSDPVKRRQFTVSDNQTPLVLSKRFRAYYLSSVIGPRNEVCPPAPTRRVFTWVIFFQPFIGCAILGARLTRPPRGATYDWIFFNYEASISCIGKNSKPAKNEYCNQKNVRRTPKKHELRQLISNMRETAPLFKYFMRLLK